MRISIILSMLLIFALTACNKTEEEEKLASVSVNYEFGFSTELKPLAIAADKDSGFVFVVNYCRYIDLRSSKIQKYNLKGELIKTIVDFESFNNVSSSVYQIVDMCINSGCIYVLAFIFTIDNSAYCIDQFDFNGNLLREYSFEIEDFYNVSLACSSNYLYVMNNQEIRKISKETGFLSSFDMPPTDGKNILFVSDIVIEPDETIFFTGADVGIANFDTVFSSCHFSKLIIQNERLETIHSLSNIGSYPPEPNKSGIALNENGYIYIATGLGSSLEIYDQKNRNILIEQIKTGNGQNTYLTDVALCYGNIYLLDSRNSMVYVYSEKYD